MGLGQHRATASLPWPEGFQAYPLDVGPHQGTNHGTLRQGSKSGDLAVDTRLR